MEDPDIFVGLDVHKDTITVALADAGRGGEVRRYGEIANTPDGVARLVKKIGRRHRAPEYVYEAGPCGYVLYRQLNDLGVSCRIVAPSHTPRGPADRIKNDVRDAEKLARLSRAGELTYVWVPDPVHEAMHDLVRARYLAAKDVRQARAHVQMFLLKHGQRFDGKSWTGRHRRWIADRRFEHAGQQIALQSFMNRIEQAEARKRELEDQIAELTAVWSLAPVVTAI